jgi:hypothetical protein
MCWVLTAARHGVHEFKIASETWRVVSLGGAVQSQLLSEGASLPLIAGGDNVVIMNGLPTE